MTQSTVYPKRLIEVDLPIKRISAHARREKSIRHGHISTLHIWWARRPLAACRAVICAALWPDPADPLCPESFREIACFHMKKWAREHLDLLGQESYKLFIKIRKNPALLEDNIELRKALLNFIADFSNWDNSTNKEYLEISRALTKAAHEALGGIPDTKPLLLDTFAGGGAIPLEALRVGADVFASDLNPVAILLNKILLLAIPKYGEKLTKEILKWGEWIKKHTEKELIKFYPKDPDGSTPIAYLWGRTIISNAPDDGTGIPVELPMIRSFWLAKKKARNTALRWATDTGKIKTKIVKIKFNDGVIREIHRPILEIFNPRNEKEVAGGTVKQGSVTCPITGYTTSVDQVRLQMASRFGGAADSRLLCVVVKKQNQVGRFYRTPIKEDFHAIQLAEKELRKKLDNHNELISLLPDEPTPLDGTGSKGGGYRTRKYGITTFSNFFTPRQSLALVTFGHWLKKAGSIIETQYSSDFAIAINTCLALVLDKVIQYNSSLCRWKSTGENVVDTFGRQALPIVWDFAEANPNSGASGDFLALLNWHVKVLSQTTAAIRNMVGFAECTSATKIPLPDDAAQAFITDPPYYDSVPYAELSDFFYVWLKRFIYKPFQYGLTDKLTPKTEECVVDLKKGQDRKHFERIMIKAMAEGRRILAPRGIGIVVFAHKSTSGWEAQLQAMIDAGWIITGSWPIDTEMETRLRAKNSAVLASSIHLVCRPRENYDGSLCTDIIGDWRDVLHELPKRIHEWMPRLAAEGVVGADAIFACLGPALEIFSRYSMVEKASGEQVTLKEYLEHVWAAVAKEALNMIFEGADATGFEEDSRLTAMWLWTLSTGVNSNGKEKPSENDNEDLDDDDSGSNKHTSGGYVLEYDAARKIAQGLGAYLEKLNSIVEIKGDKARLLPVSERASFLFGTDKKQVEKKSRKKEKQLTFFDMVDEYEEENWGWGEKSAPKAGETVLNNLHQTMLLFAAGRSEAIKRFLIEDGVGRDQRFWRLAQAFSALYPPHSDEKRWVDGVLARKKNLGF